MYCDVGKMKVTCELYHALHFILKQTMVFTVRNHQVLGCCQKRVIFLISLMEPLSHLRHLLTALNSISKGFQASICAYNNSLTMSCMKANWILFDPENSTFNPTMTAPGRTYHFSGAMVLPANLCLCFLYVYIHDTD